MICKTDHDQFSQGPQNIITPTQKKQKEEEEEEEEEEKYNLDTFKTAE
jgi:hypothetical protein